MFYRLAFILMLLSSMKTASAEERVFRSPKAIHDGNLYNEVVHVDFGDEKHPSKVVDMFYVMPRVETVVIGGTRFHEDHLSFLAKLKSLRVLVLDSVDISDKALAEFQQARPDLVLIRSQRLAIDAIARLSSEILITTRLSEEHPQIRQLLGDRYFQEATEVNFGKLPDTESGPWDRILNEELAPLRMLPTLTRLDLSWTRLNDGGMYYLKPLTRMEWLDIPTDEVSADGLVHLKGMTRLKTFGGPIDDVGMQHLTGLQALEMLSISPDSAMTDAGLELIGQLPRLKSLSVTAPQIKGTGLRHLARLTDFEVLTLGVGVRDITALPDFPALHSLSLAGTALSDEQLAPLAECRQVETLTLDKTAVGDQTVILLSRLPRLRYLSLRETQVGDEGLAALQKLPDLRGLSLASTRVTNAGLAVLQKFPALEDLTLHEMPLNEEGIQHLLALRKLKSLSVTYPYDSFSDPQKRNAANRELRERLNSALSQ